MSVEVASCTRVEMGLTPTAKLPNNMRTNRKPVASGPLVGWGGGSFWCGDSVIGWDERHGCFWVHSFRCVGDRHEAAALVQAVRKQARQMSYRQMFWQVIPDRTGDALLKTLGKGRAKVDFIQMYTEV